MADDSKLGGVANLEAGEVTRRDLERFGKKESENNQMDSACASQGYSPKHTASKGGREGWCLAVGSKLDWSLKCNKAAEETIACVVGKVCKDYRGGR